MSARKGIIMANEEVDRRAEILNAAVELFGTLGYYGTSLQKIADRVGLTKAGVLHYVGSKEGLLTAALDKSTIPRRKTFLPT